MHELFGPHEVRIQDIMTESPERNASALPFDPEEHISPTDWQLITDDIRRYRRHADPERFAQYCARLKIVSPERYEALKLTSLEHVILRDKTTPLESGRLDADKLYSNFVAKVLYPDLPLPLISDTAWEAFIQESASLEDLYKYECYGLLALLYQELIHKLDDFNEMQEKGRALIREYRASEEFPDAYIIRNAYYLRLFQPTLDPALTFTAREWQQIIHEVIESGFTTADNDPNGKFSTIFTLCAQLRILEADELRITANGLELIKAPTPASPGEVPLPEQRKY